MLSTPTTMPGIIRRSARRAGKKPKFVFSSDGEDDEEAEDEEEE